MKCLYDYAGNGKTAERKPAEDTVDQISAKESDGRDTRLEVVCSGGTYIRAFTRDMGRKRGTGSAVTEQTHTAIGEYPIDEALTIKTPDEQWVFIAA